MRRLSAMFFIMLVLAGGTAFGKANSIKPKQTGAVSVNDQEWGKRMAAVLKNMYSGLDNSAFGARERVALRSKKVPADKIPVSKYAYVAKSEFDSGRRLVGSFTSKKPELAKAQSIVSVALDKFAQAKALEIELSKPGVKKDEKTSESWQKVMTLFTAGFKTLGKSDKELITALGKAYPKYCPKQISLLPYFLRSRINGKNNLPPVRLGFNFWKSLDKIRVLSTEKDSAAEKAGFMPGDYVVGVEGGPKLTGWEQYYGFLKTKKPGDVVKFQVLRDNKPVTLTVHLMAR